MYCTLYLKGGTDGIGSAAKALVNDDLGSSIVYICFLCDIDIEPLFPALGAVLASSEIIQPPIRYHASQVDDLSVSRSVSEAVTASRVNNYAFMHSCMRVLRRSHESEQRHRIAS
jgi:hypothetical protein